MSRKSDEPKFQSTETQKNSSFEERSRSLFSSLDECTKLTPQSSLYQKKSHNNERSNDSSRASRRDTEDFRNRESIFKLSEREESGWPPSNKLKSNSGQWERGRNQDSDFGREPKRQGFKRPFNRPKIPDHARNPSKYTKYSLADTPNVSDRSNTQTAFAFLKELSDRKSNTNELKQEDNETTGKIKFQRPKQKSEEPNNFSSLSTENTATSAISKRVLPEAVVGKQSGFKSSSSKKALKVPPKEDSASTETEEKKKDKKTKKLNTLSHLMYDDEEC